LKNLALILVGLVGTFYLVNQAQAMTSSPGSANQDGNALDYFDIWGAMETQADTYQVNNAMTSSSNIPAFQSLIGYAEGTDKTGDPYRTCYGYKHKIKSFADHPAVTGEWAGESLANLGPAYAGKISTAAGRYQILKGTWLEAKRALSLPDFSPESQDKACAWLIKRRGALDDVQAGRVGQAITKCAKEWASLPGAGYGQGERSMSSLLAIYQRAGGTLA
jgi:muramidase (phage lysozyme)